MIERPASVAALAALVIYGLMLAELALSKTHERALRERRAVEPPDDPYRWMAWTYPLGFAAMIVEGALAGLPSPPVMALGAAVFCAGKGLKYWAMASLGPCWSFRVLVVPGTVLVERGPYGLMPHPNYVGVLGEIAGAGLLLGAWSGLAAAVVFGLVLRRRIRVEERTLAAYARRRDTTGDKEKGKAPSGQRFPEDV